MSQRSVKSRYPANFSRSQAVFVTWLAAMLIFSLVIWRVWSTRPGAFVSVRTIAISGPDENPVRYHHEPFGIAVDDDGNIFISESVSGRIYRIPDKGYQAGSKSQGETVIAEGLETPSAIAFDDDGNLIVANTGAHTIVRISLKKGSTEVIGGINGISGFNDGPATQARFNGPVGIAISDDGSIFVADTYNDRIRVISKDGQVRTLAGFSEPGYADGMGDSARFDTPCGLVQASDGSLIVADTGNHRIRRVEMNGLVTTIAGSDSPEGSQGYIDEPISILIRDKNSFYVSDYGWSSIRLVTTGDKQSVVTLAGGSSPGLKDGPLSDSALNRPAGLALLPDGELAFADSANGLIRALITSGSDVGRSVDLTSKVLSPGEMRKMLEPRWPFDPPTNVRDIAGTFGEIRGEQQSDGFAWFHTGLDIAGPYGERVHAMHSERITRPLAATDAGGIRERFRTPLFEYIHLRIGRDQNDLPVGNFPEGAITYRRNSEGQVYRVRMRRGTRINAGDVIGTLNRLNHIHLVTGPSGFEFNGLSALKLPNLADTIAPVIEKITIRDDDNRLLYQSGEKDQKSLTAYGRLKIMLRAYDQVDGNPKNRRLGLYRLGYQLLRPDGSPLPDYREPLYTIIFNKIPHDEDAARLAYAPGSQSGYQGVTVFEYIITNRVRDGMSSEDLLDLNRLPQGDYVLRLIAEDYFGNQSKYDLAIRNENPK